MEDQELDILILRYLSNDLNAEEKAVFEKRMSSDESIQKAVNTYATIEKGINIYAKSELKLKLQKTHSLLENTKSFKNYKPSIKPGGGFSVTGFIMKIFLVLVVVTVVLIYFDKMPIEHPFLKEVKQKLDNIKIQKQVLVKDTIWHTIKSTKMTKDTVYISTQEEMDAFQKELKNNKNINSETENKGE